MDMKVKITDVHTYAQRFSSLSATCQSLSTPPGGSLNLSSDGIVTTATFACEVGSALLGVGLLTCQSDGTWDQLEPSCGNYNF